jgi:hypothetical protein
MSNQDKNKLTMNNYYTYDQGRKCLHCNNPIADQIHKTRVYCPRVVLPDGSIQNCKDDYWAMLKSAEKNMDNLPAEYHKKIKETLAYLFDLNLPVMTYDILDSTGIRLDYSLHTAQNENGSMVFYFSGYAIVVGPKNDTLKLINHDTELF